MADNTPTFEQIEHIARLMCGDDDTWCAMDERERNHYRHRAREVIGPRCVGCGE